ncbi:MAG: cytochrome P460 family protein [Vicinamibacterales bacterium]
MNRVAVALGLACLACSLACSLAVRAQVPGDGPRYADGTNLVRPPDYREWPFLGSGLGLTYEGETTPPTPNFTNVFVNPSSYRAFMQTGAWPNGTVFVLEVRRSQTDATLIINGGRFQTDLLVLEAEVKDSRFPDGWAFFNFGRGTALTDVVAPLSGKAVASCVECHTKHTAVERTFVQFYPTLLEVARRHGTVKPGF